MADDTVANNITGNDDVTGDPNEMNINQELVDSIEERIDQLMPTLQQMAQFEQLLQKSPDLAKAIAGICPELIMAFVQAAQEAQQGGQQGANGQQGAQNGAQPQSGNTVPGMNNGATAPNLQGVPDQDDEMESMQSQAAQAQAGPQGGPPGAPQGPQGTGGGINIPGSAQSGPMAKPSATSGGRPPPSTPGPQSPLRRQFYTGR